MSSPGGQVRQRATKDKKRPTTPNPEALTEKASEKVPHVLEKAKPYKPAQQGGEWDYKLAITVITVLAFITRFWGIRHPDQVVFDEVHFGKVWRVHVLVACCLLHRSRLTRAPVCFVLSAANLLLRRAPSLWKAALRLRRLAGRIQGRLSL
jgi:hypothetical protein